MQSSKNQQRATGYYYDGHTARAHAAELHVNSRDELELNPALRPATAFTDVTISNRVGNTPRRIAFSDGGLFETTDHESVNQWLKSRNSSHAWVHQLESKTAYALSALFLVVAFIGVSITWGIPWSSKYIAGAMPARMTASLGDSALESLDKLVFYPSTLSPARTAELQAQFLQLLPAESKGYEYQLLFRGGGKIGPNAFALPNGTIIMTDELVAIAEFDEELHAIVLHEIGHLHHRHSLRQIISHTSLVTLTTTLTGDITAAGTLIAGIPNVLMEAGFSREMETEADTYALQQMQKIGLDTEHFANIMERLQFVTLDNEDNKQRKNNEDSIDNSTANDKDDKSPLNMAKALEFFSTHPLTKDRIARFRDAESPQ